MGGKQKWRKFGKKFLIMKIMMFQIWGKLEILIGGTALAKRFGVRKECIYRILSNKRRSE